MNMPMQPEPTSQASLIDRARSFKQQLDTLKQDNMPEDFTWYGYDSMSNFEHLNALFEGDLEPVFGRIREHPVLDIGGADGDIAYFLESLGCEAALYDNPPTNWNTLRGARKLKKLLNSNVLIREVDLDSQFEMHGEHYRLVLFLGILYHLKNPFFVLERLSWHSDAIILSTRIAKRFKQLPKTPVDSAPCAYLVDPRECNNDATNFWIFSDSGLKRILERTGWRIEQYITVGDTEASNPSDNEHDERAFLYATSTRSAG